MNLPTILKLLMDRTVVDGKPLSAYKLASLAGGDQPTIHRILTGKIREPRKKNLEPIARYFGVSIAQLQGEVPIPWLEDASCSESHLARPEGFPTIVDDPRKKALLALFDALPKSEQEAVMSDLEAKKRRFDQLWEEMSEQRKGRRKA